MTFWGGPKAVGWEPWGTNAQRAPRKVALAGGVLKLPIFSVLPAENQPAISGSNALTDGKGFQRPVAQFLSAPVVIAWALSKNKEHHAATPPYMSIRGTRQD